MELATAAAGALLSASFEKLFDVLTSPDVRHLVSKTELQSQLEYCELMLPKIHAVLEDAHDMNTTTKLEKIWLDNLGDLLYDADDVLDEFAFEALRLKHGASTGRSKVTKFIPSRISSIKFIARMGSKLKMITGRMDTICSQMGNLNFGGKVVGGRGRSESESTARTPTTSLPETHFFGRDKDKKALLNMLLADGSDVVSVIPIQGMGGLGKTTLAQQLYNDDNVKLRFCLRAWVCVSDNYDNLNFTVTKTILQSVGGGACDGKNLDQLQVELDKALSGNRFIIVLDDVWIESYRVWTELFKPFRRGAAGSKIIVTTRNREIAQLTGTTQAYHLGELPYEECLSLFAQHALGANSFDSYPDLKDIGEKIVDKCKGLPLAAKTLGGLLRTKLQRHEWVGILESKIWHLPEKKNDILPALRLSYDHLPSQLKQCFAYCALFPKDYEFDIDELVLLWMAEGFLSNSERRKNLKDVGIQYFNALLSRSFFQPSSKDSARFVMHDLIHDVAQAVAGDICFHLDGSLEGRDNFITPKTRHSSFTKRNCEVLSRFEVFDEGKGLRTLLALPIHQSDGYISVNVLDMLLSKLRNLRAFSSSGYHIMEVPGSINGLKHLRYLNLSHTHVRLLPKFVCSLLNLQTLLLTKCNKLEKLPSSIGNLPNLCHLDIRGTDKLKEMPAGIGNLAELQSLGKFIVGRGRVGGLNIRELKNLSQLKGELSLEGLQNVEKFEDARDADLKGKEGIKQLVMRWNTNLDDPISDQSVAAKVLELLQPHRNLDTLVIEFYCGLEFPTWLGDPSLMSNVVKIELSNCWKSTSLPSLGRLPMLKHLIIKGMKEIKTLGYEFFGSDCGGFQSLETLTLEDMQGLEKWSPCGTTAATRECGRKFPNLLELEIIDCPVLVGECLVSLPSLCILKLVKCNESVIRYMIDLNSLRTLNIEELSGLSCLQDSVEQFEDNMTCLRRLEVRSCPDLLSLYTVRKMTSLVELVVIDCPRVCAVQIGQQEDDGIMSMWKLKHIELVNCGDEFVGSVVNVVMVEGEESCLVDRLEIRRCDSVQHLALKCKRGGNTVRRMEIEHCKNLMSISNSYEKEGSVVEIDKVEINGCPSLTTDGMKLLVGVKELRVQKCSQLESIAEESIILFDKNHNMLSSTMVEGIGISNCPNLKSLSDTLHQLTSLTRLALVECDGLELFPERGLPVANLTSLVINGCKNLKSVPKNMQNLTSLTHLNVSYCSGLKSFPEEGGLPPNLSWLDIRGCPTVKPQMIETLTSLEMLYIGGDSIIEDKLELPTTLKCLCIEDMKKLKSVSYSSSSPSLSPKCLHLHKNLSSLRALIIMKCPKLRYMSKEGLSPSLEQLLIYGCPILKNKCFKGKGISFIPYVNIIV